MQCIRRCALAALSLFLASAALALWAAAALPQWLTDTDAPERAVAIVVLGGDPTRGLEAAELYRAGYARRVFVTAPVRSGAERRLDRAGIAAPREEDLTREVLTRHGVPGAAIELLGRDLVSTADEAARIGAKLGGEPGTVLVVTSPWHVARSRLVISSALPPERLRVIGSRFESFPERWWRDQEAARNAVLEVVKLGYFFLGGAIPGNGHLAGCRRTVGEIPRRAIDKPLQLTHSQRARTGGARS